MVKRTLRNPFVPSNTPEYRHAHYINNKAHVTRINKRWKKKNADKMRKYAREWARRNHPERRFRVRKMVKKLKSVPCVDCHKKFPSYVMDFDHVRGEKTFNVGSLGNSISFKRIQSEIAKCEVVCSNCHRIRTWKRRRRAH